MKKETGKKFFSVKYVLMAVLKATYWYACWFIHNHNIVVHEHYCDWLTSDWNLMSVTNNNKHTRLCSLVLFGHFQKEGFFCAFFWVSAIKVGWVFLFWSSDELFFLVVIFPADEERWVRFGPARSISPRRTRSNLLNLIKFYSGGDGKKVIFIWTSTQCLFYMIKSCCVLAFSGC